MKKILLLVTLLLFAVQAYALSFDVAGVKANVYGEFYLSGFYVGEDADRSGEKGGTSDFDINLEGRSRLGIELLWGNFTGVFEMGADKDDYLRMYYLTYSFGGAGDVTLGQASTFAAYSFGQEALDGLSLCDYGALNDYKRPMIKYSISGFEVALIHTGSDDAFGDSVNPYGDGFRKNQYAPRVEVAYTYTNDIFEGKVFGAYTYYSGKAYKAEGDDKTFSLNSGLIGIGGTVDIYDAFVQLTAYFGANLAMTGALTGSNIIPSFDAEKDKFLDVLSYGGAIGLGYNINGIFTPQVGFGYAVSSSDSYKNDDAAMGMYVNVIVQVHKYLAIVPEFSYLDDMKDGAGNKEGTTMVAGVLFKSVF